ncbi:MAG: hypothetical protein COT71_03820 [Candidatus Andersenbacteria bacterium CG10_big_fil_rev_8_21_14_0_10_54_11]|uniref:Uncharacterized protein n=1 Tax=Candidatus Andersenbacteria bacterium CG10_big_fil_rev_8_21_14_0_10_54_11 TaxID=1974485 RepID=A0A2M6WYM4_9BACT|nr:MAG: hypothetical protein COT71_03820 [Candidatus Andersenbacteria bacterium CG10_big_fil_rev_8_21_14_0_10_54_11]
MCLHEVGDRTLRLIAGKNGYQIAVYRLGSGCNRWSRHVQAVCCNIFLQGGQRRSGGGKGSSEQQQSCRTIIDVADAVADSVVDFSLDAAPGGDDEHAGDAAGGNCSRL